MEENINIPFIKCQHCDKSYSKKNRLTQHIKRKHKNNEDGESENNTSFSCALCDRPKSFTMKSSLQRHINKVHLSLDEFLCSHCTYKTNVKSNLQRHLFKVHSNGKNVRKNMFSCSSCKSVFVGKKQLQRHRKKEHNVQPRAQIKRKCPLCSFTSNTRSKNEIITHFSEVHAITLKCEKYNFDSMDEFSRWKEDLEKQTMTCYLKKRYSKNTVNYECHRKGHFKRKGETRRLKITGSCKINGHCPSEVRATTNDSGNVSVVYVATHVGHPNQLTYARLTTTEKQYISSQLLKKIPREEIFNELRNSITSYNPQRLHLIKKQHIINIERSLHLNEEAEKHQFDPVSVEVWVQELMSSKDTALIIYKPQGRVDENFPELKEEDFLLIYMTEAQKAFLKCYGKDIVCIDCTHGLNNYNVQLYTLHTIDECREGFPCAFMFASRGDVCIFSLFFRAIKDIIGPIQTDVFMSDMEEIFYSAWISIMGPSNQRFFCTWNVLKSWRTNLNKIKSKEKKESVSKILKTLLFEPDVETFHKIMSSALKKLHSDPETKEYSEFFSGQYTTNERYRHWAYCFRTEAGIKTNKYLEQFNKKLKYCSLKGKKVQRLEKIICTILDLIKERGKPEREKLVRKHRDLRQRHKRALIIPSEHVVQDDDKWIVLSSKGTEMYTVKKVKECKKCRLQCLQCNSCCHEFTCTCMDNSIKNNMCTHIHAVARNLPVEEPTQSGPGIQLVVETDPNFQKEPTIQEEIVLDINSDSFNKNDRRTQMMENWNTLLNMITTNEEIDFVNKHIKLMITAVNATKLSVSGNPSCKVVDIREVVAEGEATTVLEMNMEENICMVDENGMVIQQVEQVEDGDYYVVEGDEDGSNQMLSVSEDGTVQMTQVMWDEMETADENMQF